AFHRPAESGLSVALLASSPTDGPLSRLAASLGGTSGIVSFGAVRPRRRRSDRWRLADGTDDRFPGCGDGWIASAARSPRQHDRARSAGRSQAYAGRPIDTELWKVGRGSLLPDQLRVPGHVGRLEDHARFEP